MSYLALGLGKIGGLEALLFPFMLIPFFSGAV